MTASASLEGPRAKLQRADHHRRELHGALAAYAALEPILITPPLIEDNGTGFVVYGKVDPPPPIELGLLLGDYISNLRSALEHVVWQLVLHAGSNPTRNHQFPILNDEAAFEKGITRWLRGVSPDHVDIIRRVQPFNHPGDPEEHPLALLRWLSNTDKHQVIHAASTSMLDADPETAGFRLMKGIGRLAAPQVRSGADVGDGKPILRVGLDPPDTKAEAEWFGQFDVRVVFGDRRAHDEAIQRLWGVVAVILDEFAADLDR